MSVMKVLLVDQAAAPECRLACYLKCLGCRCCFAGSFKEAKSLLGAADYDLVLSKIKIPGGTAYDLRRILVGHASSLYYCNAVADDYWWVPGVNQGSECWGEQALGAMEFHELLAGLVDDFAIRQTAHAIAAEIG